MVVTGFHLLHKHRVHHYILICQPLTDQYYLLKTDWWLILPSVLRSTFLSVSVILDIYHCSSIIFLLLHLSLLHLRWGLCREQSVPFSGGRGNFSWALLLSQQMFHCPSPMPPGQHLWILGECSEPNCHLNWTELQFIKVYAKQKSAEYCNEN